VSSPCDATPAPANRFPVLDTPSQQRSTLQGPCSSPTPPHQRPVVAMTSQQEGNGVRAPSSCCAPSHNARPLPAHSAIDPTPTVGPPRSSHPSRGGCPNSYGIRGRNHAQRGTEMAWNTQKSRSSSPHTRHAYTLLTDQSVHAMAEPRETAEPVGHQPSMPTAKDSTHLRSRSYSPLGDGRIPQPNRVPRM